MSVTNAGIWVDSLGFAVVGNAATDAAEPAPPASAFLAGDAVLAVACRVGADAQTPANFDSGHSYADAEFCPYHDSTVDL